MNLFGSEDAYSGEVLVVSYESDRQIRALYPYVDRYAEYRAADSWLLTNPRRRAKNQARFIHNWFRKAARNYKPEVSAEVLVGMSREEREAYLRRKGLA